MMANGPPTAGLDSAASAAPPLLRIRGLVAEFPQPDGAVRAVDGVDLDVGAGEVVGLVGESGSGKSVTALSVLQLLRGVASYPSGTIEFCPPNRPAIELTRAPTALLRSIRGAGISMVFQEPMTSLNPLHTIERQLAEAIRLHRPAGGAALRREIADWLGRAGFPNPERRLGAYPHELSGGERQRVMIAMALVNRPALLIADEPTTALDVTIQAQILELFARLRREMGMAVLWITHDLALVRRLADRIVVMQGGRVVEEGPCERVFTAPAHPYTRRLIESLPSGVAAPLPPDARDLLVVEGLRVGFPVRRGVLRREVARIRAVEGLSLRVREGMSLGLVGESGSGKTTAALAMLRLIARGAARLDGKVVYAGRSLDGLREAALRPLRREMQIVFQDPFASLNPRMSVAEIVSEGLTVHRRDLDAAERDRRVAGVLEKVGLPADVRHRYPHEFSGGQRQRIALARALILSPRLLVLDEPTSSLDVTLQSEILALLRGIQQRDRIGFILISHDLRVVRALCHELVVLRRGAVVEHGPTEEILTAPRADYTRALIAAALEYRATPGAAA